MSDNVAIWRIFSDCWNQGCTVFDKRRKCLCQYIDKHTALSDDYNQFGRKYVFEGDKQLVMDAYADILAEPKTTIDNQLEWLHKWGSKFGVKTVTVQEHPLGGAWKVHYR